MTFAFPVAFKVIQTLLYKAEQINGVIRIQWRKRHTRVNTELLHTHWLKYDSTTICVPAINVCPFILHDCADGTVFIIPVTKHVIFERVLYEAQSYNSAADRNKFILHERAGITHHGVKHMHHSRTLTPLHWVREMKNKNNADTMFQSR